MKPDYTTIYYKMYTLDGDTIKGESHCFEAMVMMYRKRLSKYVRRHERAQGGSLQYRFPHTEYVKY
jgi:hypothetical protein